MTNPEARKRLPKGSSERDARHAIDFIEAADCGLVVSKHAGRHGEANGSDRVSEIAADLSAAHSPHERKQLLRIALRTIGFDWFCYCRLTRLGEIVNRVRYFDLCSPPGWAQRYVDQRYFDIDPRMAFACRHDWPLVWDHETLAAEPTITAESNARMQRFIEDAEGCGTRSGIAFGLVDPGSLEHSVIIFSSVNPTSGWINDRVVGQAYALGLGVHAFLAGQMASMAQTPTLSDLQRRILNFTASGLSDREIAQQLNMSRSNVDYHMRQIRKKYGVLNRVQLAYLAGRLFVV
ncbi:helix-turn-helix transcriptional regulator [Trinickia dinghuensis]|uniref:LuxR family transcriptional regulator n=1 Tax=Trinickia dinghuensis TaxID=2291023 RepID=A0A3D8JZL0_9BURK|nr:LuxR family transcriptional regulator [Trinickia dinghuensis]RDU98074.1 LuxR family transcriptional regulator [Trinickia dinghuensis]